MVWSNTHELTEVHRGSWSNKSGKKIWSRKLNHIFDYFLFLQREKYVYSRSGAKKINGQSRKQTWVRLLVVFIFLCDCFRVVFSLWFSISSLVLRKILYLKKIQSNWIWLIEMVALVFFLNQSHWKESKISVAIDYNTQLKTNSLYAS